MKNCVEDSVMFDDNMYLYPQSHLSRKYEFICITPDMVRSHVDFDKFCDCISDMGMYVKFYLDLNQNSPLRYTQIKISFDYVESSTYKQNPNIQMDFMDLLISKLDPCYVLEVPWGGKRKQYFKG